MKEKIKKIKAIEVFDWFYRNICIKKCDYKGIKKLECYEKMRKIITGFEDYPVTHGQFVYSMQVKNKVCDLADKELKKKEGGEENEDQKEDEQQQKNYSAQLETQECEICGKVFIPTKPFHWMCTECFLERYHSLGEYSNDPGEKRWKAPGEPEHWFFCYECGEYFEERPHWTWLPVGWRPFCESCYEFLGPEYDKDGAEIGEEWEHAEEYGYDADLIAVNKRSSTEKNEEEEEIFNKLDKKLYKKI